MEIHATWNQSGGRTVERNLVHVSTNQIAKAAFGLFGLHEKVS